MFLKQAYLTRAFSSCRRGGLGLVETARARGFAHIGPKARPSTYKLSPRWLSWWLMPKSLAKLSLAGEKPEAPKDTVRSTRPMLDTTNHFLHDGQFRGLVGSPGRNRARPSSACAVSVVT